jgi:hypothetical protein
MVYDQSIHDEYAPRRRGEVCTPSKYIFDSSVTTHCPSVLVRASNLLRISRRPVRGEGNSLAGRVEGLAARPLPYPPLPQRKEAVRQNTIR